jgi:hypothetical protein
MRRLQVAFFLLSTFMLCILPAGLKSQSVYFNSDFETGTFAVWNAFTGSGYPIETPFAGFVSFATYTDVR